MYETLPIPFTMIATAQFLVSLEDNITIMGAIAIHGIVNSKEAKMILKEILRDN